MNTQYLNARTHQRHHGHWLKDVQFATGMVVALGGAGVLLADLIQHAF